MILPAKAMAGLAKSAAAVMMVRINRVLLLIPGEK
jgi:hypothetical protein